MQIRQTNGTYVVSMEYSERGAPGKHTQILLVHTERETSIVHILENITRFLGFRLENSFVETEKSVYGRYKADHKHCMVTVSKVDATVFNF